jgi:ATP-dependent Clp protease ATP-binding subunit ClpC
VGAPPGYVGYEEGGQLSEKIRRKPYSVVLLDEIEKAHPDVFGILLQVLDEGRLTDSWGHIVDFRNTVLILTSNIGTKLLKKGMMGFNAKDSMMDYEKLKNQIFAEMKKVFNPELINRFDETLVFHSLTPDDIRKIVDILLGRTNARLAERNIQLQLSPAVRDFLVEKGYDSEYGARPLRRALQLHVEDPLSTLLLEKKIQPGDRIEAVINDGGLITFEIRSHEDVEKPETPHETPVGSSASPAK